MPNLNVAVIGFPEYAKAIGKKSTSSDITFYDVKRGDVTISLVEPSKYPDKLASLFFATALSDFAIVVVDQIGPLFGECAIMLDCVGVKRGFIVARGYIGKDQIAPLVKDTVLEKYEFVEDDPIQIRERLFSQMSVPTADAEDPSTGSVAIDHFFDVRGVGTVVLGCVSDGAIRKHDRVRVLPLGAEAEIRSIQKHDDDFDLATRGDRVGLALKGVSVGQLDRGTVLSTDGGLVVREDVDARASLVKYWLNPLKEGMVLHVGHWMQFEPARIESVSSGGDWRKPLLRLKLQKGLVYKPGSRAVMTYLEGGKLRVMGALELR